MPYARLEEVPAFLRPYGLRTANRWAAAYDRAKAEGKTPDEARVIADEAIRSRRY